MKYRLKKLNNQYSICFGKSPQSIHIEKKSMPIIDADSYYDNEYLSLCSHLDELYSAVDSIDISKKFLTEGTFDDKAR